MRSMPHLFDPTATSVPRTQISHAFGSARDIRLAPTVVVCRHALVAGYVELVASTAGFIEDYFVVFIR